MGLVSGLAVYFIVWWTVLFAVLPWGVEIEEDVKDGTASSAPKKPLLLKKAVVTTIIAAIIWVGIDWMIIHHVYSFRGTE